MIVISHSSACHPTTDSAQGSCQRAEVRTPLSRGEVHYSWAVADWNVEGVILASALPFDAVGGLGKCAVSPIPPDELNDYYQPQTHSLNSPAVATDGQSYAIPYAGMANHIGFYALHRITTTLSAESADEAVAEAELRFRRTSVALAFTGSPIKQPSCSIRVVRWARLDEKTGDVSGWEPATPLVVDGTRVADVVWLDKMGRVVDLANLADADEDAGRMFETWYRAEQLYLTAGRQDDRRWAVLEYGRLLEDIANVLAKDKKASQADAGMLNLKENLQRALASATDGDSVSAAVHVASVQLAKLRNVSTKVRVKTAGETLGVGAGASEAAANTWDARNRQAAHARPKALSSEQVYWARAAAATYLVGYLKHRESTPNA